MKGVKIGLGIEIQKEIEKANGYGKREPGVQKERRWQRRKEALRKMEAVFDDGEI